MEVLVTDEFLRDFKRMAKRYPSLGTDVNALRLELSNDPTMGTSLGDNLYKIRLRIKSKKAGKSGGGRVITLVVLEAETVYLARIYDKSEIDTLTDKELSDTIKKIRKRLDGD